MNPAIRTYLQPLLKVQRTFLNSHEDFGRANLYRSVIGTYIGIYFLSKWNSQRKAKALAHEKVAQKENIVRDALGRCGF
uniref:ATP synthase subunit e, mitochondrial n=1 Tax=Strongyloides papillosus TaxID=174720 RepID=A0A0N5B6G8_STREA